MLQNLSQNVPFFLVKTVDNPVRPVYTTENILKFNSTGAIGANSVNHDFAIEYNEVWNAAIQKQLGGNISVQVSYIGSPTVHADSSTVLNVPSAFGGSRPFPQLAAFSTIRWDGWATFHSMKIRVERRLNRGLSFDAGYTWSKSLDDASDPGTTNAEYNLPQNPFAMRLEKALSSFDNRRRLTANAVYDMPFARNTSRWWHYALGDWRAAAILIAQSGSPFTVNLSSAAGQNVSPIGLVNGKNLERPNLVGDPNTGPRTTSRWFNTAAFVLPEQNTYGTSGRNVVTGPGLATVDLSLQKEGTLHERLKLQFRFDLYNSFNYGNLNLPGRILGAANFGIISSAGEPREVQLALKLLF